MITRRVFSVASLSFIAGIAALAVPQSAQAGLVMRIEEFSDSGFTVSTGRGYIITSTNPSATDLISLLTNSATGNPTAAIGTVTNLTGGAVGVSTNILGVTIQSSAQSSESSTSSQLVDSQVEILSSGTGPRYLQVTTSQNLFALPDSSFLRFTADNSINPTTTSDLSTSNLVSSTLITTSDTGTLGPIFVTDSSSVGTAGPIIVGNGSPVSFSITQVVNLVIASSSGTANIRTSATSEVTPFEPSPVVPEPSTLAAAFTALPLLGGIYLRRRLKK